MKQFYYTSCLVGESISGQSGFQVRAVSEPLSAEENSSALRALNYKLDIPQTYTGPFPVKLLYCRGERTGNLALQSVWLGEDPTTKRTGNYFAHVLCDLVPEINARTVLEWWKNPNWKTNNQEIDGTQLPTPSVEDFAGNSVENSIFTDAIFTEMLQDAELLELWEFLLCAWWKRTASGRIFVAAEQEKFVKALWAVCRILPEPLWRQLSFSTYEKDAMLSPAVVVGLWNPIHPEESIPQTCFNGTNLAWNTFSGNKSTIQGIPRYIQHIIQAVKNGKLNEIDNFHSGAPSVTWQRRASAETFFELVRHPDTMDITRLKDISDLPNIGRFAIKNEKRFRLLLENFFTSPLLDMWDENTIQLVYTPFFASDGEVLQKFHEQLIQIQKDRINACDVDFLKMFEQKWLPRLKHFQFSEMDLWPLFNDSPASLPKPIYQWIYPTAFRHVLRCHEPSEQIEFLTRWCFLDVDEVNEPQITGILQSNFADIVKLTMYSKFVERDMAGNDTQFSRFYFAWPEWNVRVLQKLDTKTRNRFLDYLIPTVGPTLLSAFQTQLIQNSKYHENSQKTDDLFQIYCEILASEQLIPITKSVADFARRLPSDDLLAIREALHKRQDVFLLNQKKELSCIFNDDVPSCFWSRLLFWKKSRKK